MAHKCIHCVGYTPCTSQDSERIREGAQGPLLIIHILLPAESVQLWHLWHM